MSDAKALIFDLLKTPQLSVVATLTEDGKPWARYVVCMTNEDLEMRFSTFIGSRKVAQLEKNPEIHVTAGVTSMETAKAWVQVQGKAVVTRDEAERKAFWNPMLANIYSGPDDPNYSIVIVKPYRIEYATMTDRVPKVWEA